MDTAAEAARSYLGHPEHIYIHRYRKLGAALSKPSIFGNKNMLPTR